jgi:hypothetical protein
MKAEAMGAFSLSERSVELIVALMAVEAAFVLGWRAIFRRGPAPLPFIINLLAGAFLLLALRNALAGASGASVALCLLVALAAHLADLRLRWEVAGSNEADEPPVTSIGQPTTGKVTAIAQAKPKALPTALTRGSRVRE